MLNKKLLQDYAPSNIGQQVNVNHDGCSAGTDTKKRLYIKRTVGGIVGFCHHCRDKGFIVNPDQDGNKLRDWLKGKDVDVPSVERGSLPVVPIVRDSYTAAEKVWLHKHGVFEDEMGWITPVVGGIKLTLFDPTGTYSGYQIRTLSGKPKYLTYYQPYAPDDAAWFLRYPFSGNIFITEDWLSAYRIWRDTKYSSVALLKTSITPQTLNNITALDTSNIFIWLDPDDAGRNASITLHNKLKTFVKAKNIIDIGKEQMCEPKELNNAMLNKVCTQGVLNA